MCGRFSLTTPVEMLVEVFDLMPPGIALAPRYNIAPTQQVAVVASDAPRELTTVRWGLIPHWAKDASIAAKMINARAETLAGKPSFRGPLKSRRCLVLADGFYEWRKAGRERIPHRFVVDDGQPFAFAGLWESWRDPDGQEVRSCTIVTTAANETVAEVHDRMPVILPRESHERWLAPPPLTDDEREQLLVPYPAGPMSVTEVSTTVNAVANDTPACIEPVRKLF